MIWDLFIFRFESKRYYLNKGLEIKTQEGLVGRLPIWFGGIRARLDKIFDYSASITYSFPDCCKVSRRNVKFKGEGIRSDEYIPVFI